MGPRVMEWLAKGSRLTYVGIGAAGLLVVGALDVGFGPDASFGIFYLLPIAWVSWYMGRSWGVVAGVAAGGTWATAEYAVHEDYTRVWVRWWNVGNRLALFVVVALLVAGMRRLLDRERELARTDPLTGAANWRAFREAAEAELYRMRRYGGEFSVLYCDLDDLKLVNDADGHEAGDKVLRRFVHVARRHTRTSDVISRVGGDEFAVLLPETGGPSTAAVAEKLMDALASSSELGVSIGAVTVMAPVDSIDAVLGRADQAMYRAKTSGKGRVVFEVLEGAQRSSTQ